MNIRTMLILASVVACGACSGADPKPAATGGDAKAAPAGGSKLSKADCETRLKKHGELCADGEQARQSNKSMVEHLCPDVEKQAEVADWLVCLTDVKGKEECGESAEKCKPLYDKLSATKTR